MHLSLSNLSLFVVPSYSRVQESLLAAGYGLAFTPKLSLKLLTFTSKVGSKIIPHEEAQSFLRIRVKSLPNTSYGLSHIFLCKTRYFVVRMYWPDKQYRPVGAQRRSLWGPCSRDQAVQKAGEFPYDLRASPSKWVQAGPSKKNEISFPGCFSRSTKR